MIKIKETKEAILAAAMIGFYVMDLAKDGITLDDAKAMADRFEKDAEFKQVVNEGVEGSEGIVDEIKQMKITKFSDALEIGKVTLDILAGVKKMRGTPAVPLAGKELVASVPGSKDVKAVNA